MSSKLVGWSRSKKPPYVGISRRTGTGLRWDTKDGGNGHYPRNPGTKKGERSIVYQPGNGGLPLGKLTYYREDERRTLTD